MKKINVSDSTLKTVFGSNFIKLSRPVIKIFGLNAAVLLCDLYAEYQYWLKRNKINDYGYFQSTIENVTNNTGLSSHEQRVAIEALTNYGVLKSHLYGMPAVRYFKIDKDGLEKLCNEILMNQNKVVNDVDESVVVESKEEVKADEDDCFEKRHIARSLKDIDPKYVF